MYIPVSLLLSGPVTVGEIQSISYMTNNPTAGILNWSLYIYTNPAGAGDSAGWYRSRLTAEPYLAPNYSPGEAENNWETWSTSDPLQPLQFYDGNRMGTGTSNNYNGSTNDPFFADILTGPVNVHGGTWDYRDETVEYISLAGGQFVGGGLPGRPGRVAAAQAGGPLITFRRSPQPARIFSKRALTSLR